MVFSVDMMDKDCDLFCDNDVYYLYMDNYYACVVTMAL